MALHRYELSGEVAMAQMWYNTIIPGVGTATTMPLMMGGQPRRSQVLERRSDQTRNQAFAETDESLPVRSGYWAIKALIRAADMLREGIAVVLVLVALASPAAAQSLSPLWYQPAPETTPQFYMRNPVQPYISPYFATTAANYNSDTDTTPNKNHMRTILWYNNLSAALRTAGKAL
jgi:hypothetical protein